MRRKSEQSEAMFARLVELINNELRIEKINKHTFPSNTVGPRSLSKGEANEVLNQVLEEALEDSH